MKENLLVSFSQTTACALDFTDSWICHPLPDASDHDLTTISSNLTEKSIRNNRGYPQFLYLSEKKSVNTSRYFPYPSFLTELFPLIGKGRPADRVNKWDSLY